jgi:hypothetical protein
VTTKGCFLEAKSQKMILGYAVAFEKGVAGLGRVCRFNPVLIA